MAIHGYRTGGCIDDTADNRDQGGFTGAVGAEQCQDFTAPDIQAQALQCLVAAGVGLGYIRYRNDGLHGFTGVSLFIVFYKSLK